MSVIQKLDQKLELVQINIAQSIDQFTKFNKFDRVEQTKVLGSACRIWTGQKEECPEHFLDVAFLLLCFPPEIGFFLAWNISLTASVIGFNPFGVIMEAAAKSISIFKDEDVRAKIRVAMGNLSLPENQDILDKLEKLYEDEKFRATASAQLIVNCMFMVNDDFTKFHQMHYAFSADPEIEAFLLVEIEKMTDKEFLKSLYE